MHVIRTCIAASKLDCLQYCSMCQECTILSTSRRCGVTQTRGTMPSKLYPIHSFQYVHVNLCLQVIFQAGQQYILEGNLNFEIYPHVIDHTANNSCLLSLFRQL